MNTKFKLSDKAITNALYIGAALLIVAVISVSIFAFTSQSRKNKTPNVPLFTTGSSVTTAPSTTGEATVTTGADVTTAPVTKDAVNTGVSVPVSVTYKGPIESGYVTKTHAVDTLVYSVTMNDYRVHQGIDISAEVGTAVFAAADGEITGIYKDSLMGYCISIEHADGVVTHYKNLAETLPSGIEEGVTVKAGQIIASVGKSASVEQSDASHLHFEMTKDGKALNPLDYVVYKEYPSSDEGLSQDKGE